MKKYIILVLITICGLDTYAQDRAYAQKVIDDLCQPSMHGRGYVNKGDSIASVYLRREFKKLGVQPFNNGYYHNFSLSVNTFPGELSLNDLETGRDFIIDPMSAAGKVVSEDLFIIESNMLGHALENSRALKQLLRKANKNCIVYLDTVPKKLNKIRSQFIKEFKGRAIIEVTKKLTWGVGRLSKEYVHFKILPGKLNLAQKVNYEVETEWIKNYRTRNVLGFIEGQENPDSFIVLTAHYDHLGRMGKEVYIAGANDNASGTAMMLNMAKHYAKNPPKYTMVFIAFAAEEAGLVGSYFLHKQLADYMSKDNIKFLLNMDLMGSGESGVMAVNGKVFGPEFDLLTAINEREKYLTAVKKRGKAANSDHYWFTEIGIHSFFVYLMGEYSYYHEIEDNSENLRLGPYYDKSFMLLRDFLNELPNM